MDIVKFGKTAIIFTQVVILSIAVFWGHQTHVVMGSQEKAPLTQLEDSRLLDAVPHSAFQAEASVVDYGVEGLDLSIITDKQVVEENRVKELQQFMDSITTDNTWVSPIQDEYRFTSGWGFREEIESINRPAGHHAGIDLAAPDGTAIYSIANGVVLHSEWSTGSPGGNIGILHKVGNDYYVSHYLHIWEEGLLVNKGDIVQRGQQIAMVGNAGTSTAAHLHLEIKEVPGGLIDENNPLQSINSISVWDLKDVDPIPFLESQGLEF